VGKDEMISMAVVAGGCNSQPPLEKAFAMNALGIVGQNLSFLNVIDTGNRRSLAVAFPAENRNFHLVGVRPDIRRRQDVVVPVAFLACWRIGRTAFKRPAVNRGEKFFVSLPVAHPTIHQSQSFRVREILHGCIRMTIDALNPPMHRNGKCLRVNVKRDHFSPPLSSELGARMASLAIFVCLGK